MVRSGPELLAVCHDVIRITLERQRKPCLSLNQLRAFHAHLGDHVSFYVAFVDGEPHASGLFIWDSASAYYIVGGTRAHPHHGAGALLHWHAMRDMKRHGVGVYDFVGARVHPASGSKQEGLQVFKSRFGTSLHSGHLWKYPVDPWKYRLYQSWRRLKDAVRQDHYYEDMIDNEIRTALLPRSPLFPPPGAGARQ
jgi:lipid II:glycine glycyltransferase (peptidoglycan interpeptide bridge formation enzyme)